MLRIVTVTDGRELSRAELREDGTVRYEDHTVAAIVAAWRRDHPDLTEAQAIIAMARAGWSNGYLMVALDG